MKKRTMWIIGAVVVAGAAAGAVVFHGGEEELLEVQTSKAELSTIMQEVNATGRIQPKTQVRISADVSAKIVGLHVEEGDWVERGQLLVELDRERYEASVERAEANVRSAISEARLVEQNMLKAEKDFDRSRDLVSKKLESQSALDTTNAAYQVEIARYQSALDQVEQARAALKEAEDALSKTTIYSPMSGTISDLDKEEGEMAIGSQFQEDIILVVADLSQMEAQVNVDENDIVGVAIGQDAVIEVDALFGEKLHGTVYEISNSANTNETGTSNQKTEFEVKIAIDDEHVSRLRPGMTASADINTETKDDVVGVPIQSVAVRTIDQLKLEGEEVADAEKRFTADPDGFVEIVFVVEDGTVTARQVETGIQSDDMIEIVSGVEEGQEVVTGSYRAISSDLKNGAQVSINNDASAFTGDA